MNIIILTAEDQNEDGTYRTDDVRAEHIRNVLRCQVGDTIEVGLLHESLGAGRVVSLGRNEVVLKCDFGVKPAATLPTTDIICALPRPQTLKKVLITAASMGVRRLHLIRANRVEKSYFQSSLLRPENYGRFLIEGLCQGKLINPPEIYIHKYFRIFFEDTFNEMESEEAGPFVKILPHPEGRSHLHEVGLGNNTAVTVAIGPEGGWVPFEVELIKSLGFVDVELGPWILRVETALAATLAQIHLVRIRHATDGDTTVKSP